MSLSLYNTATKQIEPFTPLAGSNVTLYTCGPTVYDYLTVGNWSAYIYWDTLVRALLAAGYTTQRVMNMTDVGHLVSDADDGEDKLEKGAKREGKNAWEVAEYYAEDFVSGMEKLGLLPPEHLVRATDFIAQQLDLVRILKEKGFTYQTSDGIYFDTSKFPSYATFGHLELAAQKAGARVEANDEKRQAWDFALWKFTPANQTRDMEWATPDDLLELPPASRSGHHGVNRDDKPAVASKAASIPEDTSDFSGIRTNVPVGSTPHDPPITSDGSGGSQDVMGFPGWHLECSAMAMSILGATIDIHTGGIDHIPVHHTNEIAQSEAASGQPFARYWVHNNHLKIEGGKISKSLGNGYTLQDIEQRGYTALDLRMFVLQSQYINEGNFTFENLQAAQNRLKSWRHYAVLRHQTHDILRDDDQKNDAADSLSLQAAAGALREALMNNLNAPEALQIVDGAFSKLDHQPLDTIHRHGLLQLLEAIDELLGLQLLTHSDDVSDDAKMLILERQRAREAKDWKRSDALREELAEAGIIVKDTANGVVWQHDE